MEKGINSGLKSLIVLLGVFIILTLSVPVTAADVVASQSILFNNGTDPNIPQYRLTVAKTGTGNGTVTNWPAGIDCGPDCSDWYDYGTEVTLTAISDEGSYFEGWSGGDCQDTVGCTLVISGHTNLTANFQSKNFFDRWDWHWRNPLPQGNSLFGITYGDGAFVAVGDRGAIITSSDGITWTAGSSGTSNGLRGITYGKGTFVAVGDRGATLTSADGITWTARASGTLNWLYGITYGNGTFVAVGEGGAILTSVDSMTWSVRSSGTSTWLTGITYGNGTFVAVGDEGAIV
ncbi:MAG: hypothetical protein HY730_03840, partial [Candidatus Tectomicrobia bacterium]|nr:hypothetical protein [Candidatus Tectomicrobia bacterium]